MLKAKSPEDPMKKKPETFADIIARELRRMARAREARKRAELGNSLALAFANARPLRNG